MTRDSAPSPCDPTSEAVAALVFAGVAEAIGESTAVIRGPLPASVAEI